MGGSAGMVVLMVTIITALLCMGAAAGGQPPFSCWPGAPYVRFCDQRVPVEQRAADLVARLTLAEKVSQLGDVAAAVPRLGVPAYKWWSEGLHGLSMWGKGMHFTGAVRQVTSFPQVLLTAASFDEKIWYFTGQAIGVEARALYNIGQAEGLTIWSPNVNIYRDPRWGRGHETPGEDPVTASKYAVAFVRGLQGPSPTTLQTSACCKHATAYDLDDWRGTVRYNFNARVTPQDLADTFNPPFRSCVSEGQASCVMCAYTAVNGVPACADYNLFTKTFRGEWGLKGYVASDCDAIALVHNGQHFRPTPEDTVATTLKAGMDMNCGNYTQVHGMAALRQGKMTERDVDRTLINLFSVRMRLGHFNGDPRSNPMYGHFGANDVCSPAHKNLALHAAESGIVLLKNDAGILPLRRWTVGSVAVIGPNANDPGALLGNYFGPPCETITLLQGLNGYVKDVRFEPGCIDTACWSAATGRGGGGGEVDGPRDPVHGDEPRAGGGRAGQDEPAPPRAAAEPHRSRGQRGETAGDPGAPHRRPGGRDVREIQPQDRCHRVGRLPRAGRRACHRQGALRGAQPQRQAAGDVVPRGVHEGADDGHADARRPGHRLPRPYLPLLPGTDRLQVRLRPQLLQVLPPARSLRTGRPSEESARRPDLDGSSGRRRKPLRRGGDRG
ncbi:hypothetical protein ACQJBY_037650 [Aegilops geniculata]